MKILLNLIYIALFLFFNVPLHGEDSFEISNSINYSNQLQAYAPILQNYIVNEKPNSSSDNLEKTGLMITKSAYGVDRTLLIFRVSDGEIRLDDWWEGKVARYSYYQDKNHFGLLVITSVYSKIENPTGYRVLAPIAWENDLPDVQWGVYLFNGKSEQAGWSYKALGLFVIGTSPAESNQSKTGLSVYQGKLVTFPDTNPSVEKKEEGVAKVTIDYEAGLLYGDMEFSDGSRYKLLGEATSDIVTINKDGQTVGTLQFNFFGKDSEEIGGVINYNQRIGLLGLKKARV